MGQKLLFATCLVGKGSCEALLERKELNAKKIKELKALRCSRASAAPNIWSKAKLRQLKGEASEGESMDERGRASRASCAKSGQ